jgi:NAD(P)H-flavin reductase
MLYAFGAGEAAVSISGDPAAPGRLVHTVRAVGPVTRAIGGLKRGGVLGVRGPFGAPWPVSGAQGKDIIIVAGGLGLAPLRPLVYQLLGQRGDYGRAVLLYGARSPTDILFVTELKAWRGRFDLDLEVTVDRGGEDWRGPVGVVTELLARATFDPAACAAFVCGPEVMMRLACRELRACGVSEKDIFLSLERNMKCAVGLCGHCQYGAEFVCKDGPVFPLARISRLLGAREM